MIKSQRTTNKTDDHHHDECTQTVQSFFKCLENTNVCVVYNHDICVSLERPEIRKFNYD